MKPKAPKKPKKPKHSYLISPVNMVYSNIDDQQLLVERLKVLADSLSSLITIDMFREYDDIAFGKKRMSCATEKTVISCKDDIEHLLSQANFGYEKTEEKVYDIEDSKLSHIVFKDNVLAKCYSLYSTPNKLDAGWIYRLFRYCDFVRIFIKPIDPSKYTTMLRGSMKTAALTSKKDTIDSSGMINIMKEKVLNQNVSQIVSVRVVFGVLGLTKDELDSRTKKFLSKAKGMRATVRSLPYSSKTWLENGRTDLYVETDSLHPIFPFISSELSEKGGTTWGVNKLSGRAVIYDYKKRRNYNIGIVATSGAGKSHTIKIILARAEKKYPESFFFFVDIENEYVEFGKTLGFSISEIDANTNLGMDPFNYMSAYKSASLLADILNVETLTRYAMLKAAEQKECVDIPSMIKILEGIDKEKDTKHADQMQILQMGPIEALLSGKPTMKGSTIIALKNSFAVNSDEHRFTTRIALEFALMHCTKLPKIVPKFIILDEGWALFKDESTGESVEELARRARKYNITIMLATQNIADVLKHEHALTLFNNCDTKIYLQHKSSEKNALMDVLHLSEYETTCLIRAKPGEGMIHASENVVSCKFLADDKELELFNTNPNE